MSDEIIVDNQRSDKLISKSMGLINKIKLFFVNLFKKNGSAGSTPIVPRKNRNKYKRASPEIQRYIIPTLDLSRLDLYKT